MAAAAAAGGGGGGGGSAMAGWGADYYSVDDMCAQETLVPARLVHGCTGA